jgi:regulator of sirC expression with transglutaminase-like and TPR domain
VRTERFIQLMMTDAPPLDRIMAVIAATDPAAPSEEEIVSRLDDLARQITGFDPKTVVTGVFGGLGFTGNAANYYDARNSMIHHVLDRRLGIPLTLAVVAAEIARRRGVTLRAIGMPGHVLLGSVDGWHDPFAGGASLDLDDCKRIFHTIHPDAPFLDRYLHPMTETSIAARTLENLRLAGMGSGNLAQLAAVLELRALVPDAPVNHRMEYARVLEALGRYDLAAEQRDLLAELLPKRADHHIGEAARLRAHRN